ncbi:MAG TPA: hypothetical protein VL171_17195 [Verrucomicrobiae bacterium]|nr:hypothetical protein [Verrucomicrobiae bacterium]
MSLINEALKRAQDTSYPPVAPPPMAPSYQNESRADKSKSGLMVTVVVALVAVVGVAMVGLRVAKGLQKLKDGFASSDGATADNTSQGEEITRPLSPQPPTMAKVETPAPAPALSIPTTAQSSSTPSTTQSPASPSPSSKAAEDELVGRVMEKIKAEQAAEAPKPAAEPPQLALQGITLAADGSEAMINGISLREGEDIEGAKVVSIERRAVRLQFDGREIVLHLP